MRRSSAYRSSAGNRLYRLFQNVFLGFSRAPVSKKILYVALTIGTLILFFPWVTLELEGGGVSGYNSFHLINGGIGFFILLIFAALLFVLGYADDRERIKATVNIVFREHSIIIFAGALICIMCLMIFFSLLGYSRMTTGNIHINTRTSGIVFEILVAVLILFSGVLNYKEGQKDMKKRIYIENASSEYAHSEQYDAILGKEVSDEDSNMKLPI